MHRDINDYDHYNTEKTASRIAGHRTQRPTRRTSHTSPHAAGRIHLFLRFARAAAECQGRPTIKYMHACTAQKRHTPAAPVLVPCSSPPKHAARKARQSRQPAREAMPAHRRLRHDLLEHTHAQVSAAREVGTAGQRALRSHRIHLPCERAHDRDRAALEEGCRVERPYHCAQLTKKVKVTRVQRAARAERCEMLEIGVLRAGHQPVSARRLAYLREVSW